MKKTEKLLFYKCGAIVLLIADLWMLFKCAFFEISERIVSYLQIGGSILGGLGNLTSSSMQDVINSLSQGKITIFQFQKMYEALGDYMYTYEDGETLFYMTRVFYWCIIAFAIMMMIEAVLHLINSKVNGYVVFFDVIFACVTGFFWFATVNGLSEEFGASAIRITPAGIGIFVIPLIASVLWGKYYSVLAEVKASGEETETDARESMTAVDVKKGEWAAYMKTHKVTCGILGVYFLMYILPFIFDNELKYEILPYIKVLDAVLIGILLVHSFCNDWKMHAVYIVVNLAGGVIFHYEYMRYYNFRCMMEIFGTGLILTLLMYILQKVNIKEYKLIIVTGILLVLKVFIIPLYGAGYFMMGYSYITTLEIFSSNHVFLQIIGILCPVIIYYFRPEYFCASNSEKIWTSGNMEGRADQDKEERTDPKLYAEARKIDMEIKAIKKRNDAAYIALGQRIFKLEEQGDGRYGKYVEQIKSLQEENRKLNEKIGYINGICVCPQCGAENSIDNNFCMRCGKKLASETDVN